MESASIPSGPCPEAMQSKPPVVEWQRTEIATPAVLPTGPAKPGNKRPCFSLSNSKPLVPQLSFGTPTCTPNASLSPPQGLPLGKPLPVPSCPPGAAAESGGSADAGSGDPLAALASAASAVQPATMPKTTSLTARWKTNVTLV